jgi:hypothetical protein
MWIYAVSHSVLFFYWAWRSVSIVGCSGTMGFANTSVKDIIAGCFEYFLFFVIFLRDLPYVVRGRLLPLPPLLLLLLVLLGSVC